MYFLFYTFRINICGKLKLFCFDKVRWLSLICDLIGVNLACVCLVVNYHKICYSTVEPYYYDRQWVIFKPILSDILAYRCVEWLNPRPTGMPWASFQIRNQARDTCTGDTCWVHVLSRWRSLLTSLACALKSLVLFSIFTFFPNYKRRN